MEKKHECCTPKGQVSRYVDCIGCDKKPIEGATLSYAQAQKDSFNIMEKKQSSVEWLLFELSKNGLLPDGIPSDIHNKAKAMHREETEQFGAVCCLKTTQKNQWSLEQLYNETFGGYTGVIVFDDIRLINTSGTNHLSHINPLTHKTTNGGSNE